MAYTIECVPNFSEGRESKTVRAIADAIDGPRVSILDVSMDADHNRSVITFAGDAEEVGEAALRAIGRAATLIDLNHHTGAHPRIGSTDVAPFVPLAGASLLQCADIAYFVAEQAWERYGVPTYLYGAAAKRADRSSLETIRRGGFERLREEVKVNPDRRPDFGVNALHPTAGATAVGARDFLVAFNVNLNTSNVEIAKAVARRVRTSSGGLPAVKALGLYLPSGRLAQVSMNLIDFKVTSVAAAFEAVEREARAMGADIVGSEVIGLIPRAALEGAPLDRMKIAGFKPAMILENRLAELSRR